MKIRHISAVVCFLVVCFNFHKSGAQGTSTLYIDSLPGFPVAQLDSAYEGQSYAFNIILINNTNIAISNFPIQFNMRVDSVINTFFTSPPIGLQPGDTVSISVTGFNFTQPQFKPGNNIVVVWPVLNGLTIPVDSITVGVYFVPLNSVGSTDFAQPSLRIYPVPSNNTVYFDTRKNQAEDVRIWTILGQQVFFSLAAETNAIDITPLSPGVYILDVLINGARIRQKFIRE